MNKRVLIGSVVNQSQAILQNFLLSLTELETENLTIDYFFMDNNEKPMSKNILQNFKPATGNVSIIDLAAESFRNPIADNDPWETAGYHNRIINHCRENEYDYLFLINSDLIIHPKTLTRLASLKKDIIAEIYWFAVDPKHQYPQVLKSLDLYFFNDKYGENKQVNELKVKHIKFYDMLKMPGVYEAAEVRGCTLISLEVLKKGVSFTRIDNLSFQEPASHFSLRAGSFGYKLYVDTYYPALHLNKDSDLKKINGYKADYKVDKVKEILDAQKKIKMNESLSVVEYQEKYPQTNLPVDLKDSIKDISISLLVYKLDNALLLVNGLIASQEGVPIKDSIQRERHFEGALEELESVFYCESENIIISGEKYTIIDGEYISLIGPWASTFWHWMAEYLSKAAIAEAIGFKGKYIVNPEAPFMMESLLLMGISFERLLIINEPKNFLIRTLYLIESFPMYNGEKILIALKLLREKFLSRIIKREGPKRKIYISRQQSANQRKIANENELVNLLEKFGFENIIMENLSLKEQIEIMVNADFLIGGNGSGMLHSLFMPEGSLVIELFSPTYTTSAIIPVVELLKHNYHMVTSPVQGDYPYGSGFDASIFVPVDLVRVTLENHIANLDKSLSEHFQNIFITNQNNFYLNNFISHRKLNDLLEKYNFTTVYVEELSPEQLETLMGNTKCLISADSSDTTACRFMPSSSVVIELFEPNYINPEIITVIESFKQQYFMLTFPHDAAYQGIPGRDFTPPVDLLGVILQNTILGSN
jgi:capsular polysaccharide biosynthesis protein